MVKSIIMPSIIVFLITFSFVNIIYGCTHYGFGSVVIPDWYIADNDNYLFEPMPTMPFVRYWIKQGFILSLFYGTISFFITLAFTTYRKRKHNIEASNFEQETKL